MTYQHKVKCLGCGLHFVLLSWDETKGKIYCPDCGQATRQLRWVTEVKEPVCAFVPGDEYIRSSFVSKQTDEGISEIQTGSTADMQKAFNAHSNKTVEVPK